MTPRSFDAWVSLECERLNEEAEAAEDSARGWRRLSQVYLLAALICVVLSDYLPLPWAGVPACAACFFFWRESSVYRRYVNAIAESSRCTGAMAGLVEAATHPSRSSTLIARAPFDRKREEASN